jgi:hypothetical protein
MRILILNNIQGNLPAFEAVLKAAQGKWDYVWCFGNVVGYGLEPNECIELLRTLPHVCVAGANEWGVLQRVEIRQLTSVGRAAVSWTQQVIRPENSVYLEALPIIAAIGDFTLVHGSPREPLWEYITLAPLIAALNFPHLDTPHCICGCVPRAELFTWSNDERENLDAVQLIRPTYNVPYNLKTSRNFISCGGVGISGNGTPDYAEYGILDVGKDNIEFRRCQYNVEDVVKRLEAANFSKHLIGYWRSGWF